jgi:AraC-like DNA-binding protein
MTMHTALNVGFRSYTSLVEAHAHSFFQIVLPSRGVLELEIAGRGGRVDQDCAAIIGAGDRHVFSATAATNRFLVLDVTEPKWMQTGTSAGNLLDSLSERRYVTLTPAAHHLIGYAEQILTYTQLATPNNGRLTSLWLELLLEALSPESCLKRDRPTRALARATAFMDRFYDQPIQMMDLTRVAGLGASRLYELFLERLGTTPRGYLENVRLRQALALLANTQLSIAEIAVRTGHTDQSALTRHLRRARGTTPAAYRRACISRLTASGDVAHPAGEPVKKH